MLKLYKGGDETLILDRSDIGSKFTKTFSNIEYMFLFFQYYGDDLSGRSMTFSIKSGSVFSLDDIFLIVGILAGLLVVGVIVCVCIRIKMARMRREFIRRNAPPELTPEQMQKKKEELQSNVISTEFTEDKAKFNESSCTICLVEFKTGDKVQIVKNCNHLFHEPCLQQWINAKIKTNILCPNCNKPILPEPVAAKNIPIVAPASNVAAH